MVIFVLMILIAQSVVLAHHMKSDTSQHFKGNLAGWEDFPSFVCIWVEAENRIHLSGVLVTPKTVFTSAYVWTIKSVSTYNSTAHAGWVYKKKQKQWRSVKKVVPHANFVKGQEGIPNKNDVALVELTQSFVVDETVRPIVIHSEELIADLWIRILVLDSLCYVVGTGNTEVMNILFFEVKSVNCTFPDGKQRNSVICTSPISPEFNVCPPSQYGVPLFCDDLVFGIFLHSDFICCNEVKHKCEEYLFFTFLGHYLGYFNISTNDEWQGMSRNWIFIMFLFHFLLGLL